MPLVINNLRSEYTHIYTHTNMHTDVCTEPILRNRVRAGLQLVHAWFKNILELL